MDLHRPKHLDDFEFQPSVSVLKQFMNQEIPNMIFYGAEGSGKKSLIYAFLRDKYGVEAKNIKCINKTFKINSKDVEIPYFYSNHHIEILVGDMTNYTRNILPEIIKTIGATRNILNNNCKVLILHGAEQMDSFTQNMMRRFFETYYKTCRFILVTKYLNRIIKPLQSRCLLISVPAPTNEQIKTIIPNYSSKHRNMKLAWIEQYMKIPHNEIEIYIKNVLNGKKSNPQEMLYSLLVKNYDFLEIIEIIYETLRTELKHDNDKLRKCIEIIAKYSRRLCEGTREILHIEALLINLNIVL